MAEYADVMQALRNADAAGDTEAARRLAGIAANMRSATEPMNVDPTEGMTNTEKRIAGYGSVLPSMGANAAYLIRQGLEAAGGKKLADTIGLTTEADLAERRKRDALLAASGTTEAEPRVYSGPEGAKGGRLGIHRGEYSQGLIPGPGAQGMVAANMVDAIPLAMLPGANTVLGSGLYGAAYGSLAPAESNQARLTNMVASGVASSALTAAARAPGLAYKAGVAPFTEKGQERIALNAISQFADDPQALKKLSISGDLVPGSKASLAEVTGDPGIAQLERAAKAASPDTASMFATRSAERLQARKDALLSIAGQQGEKDAAIAVRDAAARRLYSRAWQTPIDPADAKLLAPEIKTLLARPSVQEARSAALRLAKEEGEVLSRGDLNGGSVKGMHYLKLGLDDAVSAAKRAGNDNEARLLMRTRDKFLTVLDALSPAYKKARAEYSNASKPINRMEIGQYMYDKLIPALNDLGAERTSPAAFARALKEGDEMAKRATGFQGAKLGDILTSDQINLLVNIGKDLGREAGAAERGRVPGSPTAQYLSSGNAMHELTRALGFPQGSGLLTDTVNRGLNNLPLGIGGFMREMGRAPESGIQNKLALFLANPELAKAAEARMGVARGLKIPGTQRTLTLNDVSRYGLPPVAIGGGTYLATRP